MRNMHVELQTISDQLVFTLLAMRKMHAELQKISDQLVFTLSTRASHW